LLTLEDFRSIYQDENLVEEAFLEYINTLDKDYITPSEFLENQKEIDVSRLGEESAQLYYLISQLEYIKSYHDFISSMEQRTKDLLQSSLFNAKNSFTTRNIVKTQSDFE